MSSTTRRGAPQAPHAPAGVPTEPYLTPVDRLATVAPSEEASVALRVLAGRDVDQVPVVQDGHLVGLLRRRDVLRWLQVQAGQAA